MATAPGEVTERRFYRNADIMRLLECSKSTAYRIIARLNAELAAQNKIVIQGRVSAAYADARLGIKEVF